MLRKIAAALMLGLVTAGAPVAGPFQDGVFAYVNGDFGAARQIWKDAAQAGDAKAHYRLGLLYDSGLGVTQDYDEAARWFRESAAQGEADHIAVM